MENREITADHNILVTFALTAMGEGQSRELIATLATKFYGNREDHENRA